LQLCSDGRDAAPIVWIAGIDTCLDRMHRLVENMTSSKDRLGLINAEQSLQMRYKHGRVLKFQQPT